MKVVCAWCDKDQGEKEPLDDPTVTHGICDPCAERVAEDEGFLDELRRVRFETELFDVMKSMGAKEIALPV